MLSTGGDRRMYLNTTSMGSGYLAECLMSMEMYKKNQDPSVLGPSIRECRLFISDFVSTLERNINAPFVMQHLIANYFDEDKHDTIQKWNLVKSTIEKAENGQSIDDIDNTIYILQKIIDDFSQIRTRVLEKPISKQRMLD